jgi:hypothetical protein
MGILDVVYIIGATAWWQTALVYKSGPFNWFSNFKEWTIKRTNDNSPLSCSFCTGPYVLLLVLVVQLIFPVVVTFFGILGIAAAIRGMSNEY